MGTSTIGDLENPPKLFLGEICLYVACFLPPLSNKLARFVKQTTSPTRLTYRNYWNNSQIICSPAELSFSLSDFLTYVRILEYNWKVIGLLHTYEFSFLPIRFTMIGHNSPRYILVSLGNFHFPSHIKCLLRESNLSTPRHSQRTHLPLLPSGITATQ